MTSFEAMDADRFWKVIENARSQVRDPADGEVVAAQAAALLSAYPREQIVAAQQALSDLMADSYRNLLWAAAYLITGGCSDNGFVGGTRGLRDRLGRCQSRLRSSGAWLISADAFETIGVRPVEYTGVAAPRPSGPVTSMVQAAGVRRVP
jgi:hypothetical protein